MTANAALPPAKLPSLWRYLWSWVVGALLVVWTTLLVVAWYTGHHEAEEITDGQLESVARLWLSVEPDKTLSIPEPIASNRARAYVQDVAVLHWVDGQLFTDTHNLAEGAGAAALAALMQEQGAMAGRKVGVILSGGNVDRSVYAKVIG